MEVRLKKKRCVYETVANRSQLNNGEKLQAVLYSIKRSTWVLFIQYLWQVPL